MPGPNILEVLRAVQPEHLKNSKHRNSKGVPRVPLAAVPMVHQVEARAIDLDTVATVSLSR